jgi:hypothetical protein
VSSQLTGGAASEGEVVFSVLFIVYSTVRTAATQELSTVPVRSKMGLTDGDMMT